MIKLTFLFLQMLNICKQYGKQYLHKNREKGKANKA